MSKTLEKGEHKIQEICDKLRKETLDPAKIHAENIVKEAHQKAEEMIASAERHCEKLFNEARRQIAKEEEVFHTSLNQSVRQTLEALRQQITEHLFVPALVEKIDRFSSQPDLIKNLISSIAEAIQKEGMDVDLSIEISKLCSPDEIVHAISKELQERLRIKSITVGNFHGGIRVRLIGKNYIVDMSNSTLIELFSQFCRKDVRDLLFELKKAEN